MHKLISFALALGAFAGSTLAETLTGLSSTGRLYTFDPASPAMVVDRGLVSGMAAGQKMFSIDYQPGTGILYGVATHPTTGVSQMYTINPANAVATPVSGSTFNIVVDTALTNYRLGMDFNPATGIPRLISNAGENFRLDVATGLPLAVDTVLDYVPGDSTATPSVINVAYSLAQTPTVYGYDYQRDAIVRIGGVNGIPSANGGGLTTVGNSGIVARSSALGFEFSDLSGGAVAYLTAATGVPNTDPEQFIDQLYTLNVQTGALTSLGQIGTNVQARGVQMLAITAAIDAPVPEPTSLLGIASLAVVARRSRR